MGEDPINGKILETDFEKIRKDFESAQIYPYGYK